MDRISSLVYRLSALSYTEGKDSVRLRAKAEAELIERFAKLESELASVTAERDRLIVGVTRENEA